MAGMGSRFTQNGYSVAKPMLPIHNVPMFLLVLYNLYGEELNSVTLIKQNSLNLLSYEELFESATGIKVNIINLDAPTNGAASTVALALEKLQSEMPVVIANSDQYVDMNVKVFYSAVLQNQNAGAILTMEDNDPKWSYARVNNGTISEVVEKEVISDYATVGIYGFRSSGVALNAINKMKSENFRVNNEFYLAPAYNFIDSNEGKTVAVHLGKIGKAMHGLGIPSDYESFLENPVSFEIAKKAREFLKMQ
jgi:NDP-sugar pyrophosphorylase family protein